jgi:Disintegrin./Fibronectin type III domain.
MRTVVAVTSLFALGLFTSCVNVDKPALIAECEQPGGCPTEDDGGLDAPLGDLAIGQDESLDESAEETSADVRLDSARDRVETGAPDGPQIGPDGTSTGPDTIPNADTIIVTVPDTAPPPVLDAPAEVPVDVPPDADEGDVPSVLNGTCSYNGKPARAGTVCRLATDVCDVSETCDGISTACPLDKFVAVTEVCRAKAGACDVEEKCTGSSAACPTDKLLAKSAVCRPAASICDVAEYCDGTHAVCPADGFALATTQCRASADGAVCDPPEFCTGTSNACPADAKYTRPAAPPTGVAVVPGTLQADVSWTPITADAGTAVTGYNVKSSSISTGGWTLRGAPTTSPFTVTPITAGQPFYFVVSAYAGLPSCESANSSFVSAQSCVANAPTTVTPTPDNAGSVTLSWSLVSSATSYNVSRSTTKGGPYTVVVNGLSATSYKDTPAVPPNGSATFYYVVRANTGGCNSPYSPEATATIASARTDAAADTAKD